MRSGRHRFLGSSPLRTMLLGRERGLEWAEAQSAWLLPPPSYAWRVPALVVPLLLCSLSPRMARSQPLDEGDRAAARTLGYSGLEDFKAGNFEIAEKKLERAYAVVRVPSLGLWTARALIANGKLVKAAERLLEVTRLPAAEGDVELQQEAKRMAASEREQLLPSIPKLTIQVQAEKTLEVHVAIDGNRVPPALFGVERPVDPGKHRIDAEAGGKRQSKTVTLERAESANISFEFSPHLSLPSPAAASTAPGELGAPATDPPTDWFANHRRTFAWTSFAVGGAGVVFGTVTGVMALQKANELEDSPDCVDGGCYVPQHDGVDTLGTLRTLSTVGFVVGGVGAASGLALLLTAPSAPQAADAGIRPWFGVGSAGLFGRFQ